MEFYTIGVYNTTENEFFDKLSRNTIDTFCDIRQRRAVRGSKYSFVNSNRLQQSLKEMGIKYLHEKSLAPTKEIRELQKQDDLKNHKLKRDRRHLGKIFVNEYRDKIIECFDFNKFIDDLKGKDSKKIVLFCVEEHPLACHRSIVSDKLFIDYNFNIKNL